MTREYAYDVVGHHMVIKEIDTYNHGTRNGIIKILKDGIEVAECMYDAAYVNGVITILQALKEVNHNG